MSWPGRRGRRRRATRHDEAVAAIVRHTCHNVSRSVLLGLLDWINVAEAGLDPPDSFQQGRLGLQGLIRYHAGCPAGRNRSHAPAFDKVMFPRASLATRVPRSGLTGICLLASLLLGACGGPRVELGAQGNPTAARGLLVAAATEGPVPLEIDTAPPGLAGGADEVARIATAAVPWLAQRFEARPLGTVTPTQRRLVMRFESVPRDPSATCSGAPPRGSLGPPPATLLAVFCDGARAVADVTGTAPGAEPADTERLIRAALDRLVPGSTGYSSFPGVSLGVGVGSGGGWGLGGGLHF